MSIFCILISMFYLVWAPFVIYTAHTWFTKKYNYLYDLPSDQSPECRPYIRRDRKNWSVVEFVLVGIFLAPFKILIALSGIYVGLALDRLLVAYYKLTDVEAEQPRNFIKYSRMINSFGTGVALFGFGIRIKHYLRTLDADKYPKLKKIPESQAKSAIVVSNHVTWADIFYYMYSPFQACFISKAEVKNYPAIGFFAKTIQCIFINRDEAKDRFAVLNKLQERVQNIRAGKNFSKMVIFPEGTTTNGECLISFKKGAFVLNTPLKVVVLKYRGRMSPALNMMGTIDNLLSLLFQLYTNLDVFEVEGLIEPKSEMPWEEYAEEVRSLMASEFKLEKIDGDFSGKKFTESKYTGKPLA